MSYEQENRQVQTKSARFAAANQKAELAAIKEASDSDIDYSELPELTEKFRQNAVRNPYYQLIKKQLTLHMDADVVAWFKRRAAGRYYRTGINRALREHMERHGKKTSQ